MQHYLKIAAGSLALALGLGFATGSHADIITTDPNGTVSGSVEGSDGWLVGDTVFGGIDFLVFEADPETLFSIDVTSDIDFGISVYEGQIANETGVPFNNGGDFFDFNTFLSYVGGTPIFSAIGSSLSDLMLDTGGWYTVAIGGDEPFGGPSGSIDYVASLQSAASSPVPTPGGYALLAAGLLAWGATYRPRHR